MYQFGKDILVTHTQRLIKTVLYITLIGLLSQATSLAKTKRLVLLKLDGLPFHTVDKVVKMQDPQSGKSYLPWIEEVFYKKGTCLANFYVRGMSLSGPSWSLIDTGQHLQIKGNVEYSRLTLRPYDYLNFIPFYIESARMRRVDMPGVEVLDDLGIPLMADAYPYDERYLSFQLYQRGFRWTTFKRGLENRFIKQSPRELLDEWTIGLELRNIIFDQLELELIESLSNPKIRYLDFYSSSFDHVAHGNRDFKSQLHVLKEIDQLVGRIWTAIERSSLASETALVLVSDHGINTDDQTYSQGYNLVKLLGSPEGGGHHVITKRRLMLDYSIKGIYPLVPLITTTTSDSYYLKNQSTDYPTALLDFDGNERATIHLRNSDINLLHILLQQLINKSPSPTMQKAITDALFSVIDKHRAEWEVTARELKEELAALNRAIESEKKRFHAQPKKWTSEDRDKGLDKEATRIFARMDSWRFDEQQHKEYLRTLENLLALRRDNFDPKRLKIDELISKRMMGDHNSIYQLQNYVVGIAPTGLVLKADSSLDMKRSFARVNYFDLLQSIKVRNNVQDNVSSRPIDFVAIRIPHEKIAASLDTDLRPTDDVIWLYGDSRRQALILVRRDLNSQPLLRYLPISSLIQLESGDIEFKLEEWQPNLPLKIWEDENLNIPNNDRKQWLNGWHTDREWLAAMHKAEYSTAIIGLHEQLSRHDINLLSIPDIKEEDKRLLYRFHKRVRESTESDLLILANNHWNFDVRGFNPGGNHGSFFRVSTHSSFMIAGGDKTGIPRNLIVERPYDSLSVAPTLFTLTGQVVDGEPIPELKARGFRRFDGAVIKEVINK
jgi:hypothetical protein